MVANAALAAIASFGSLNPEKNFAVYAGLAVLVALASIAMGLVLMLGLDTLPAIEI